MLESYLEQLPGKNAEKMVIPANCYTLQSIDQLFERLPHYKLLKEIVFVDGELEKHQLERFKELWQLKCLRWIGTRERRRLPKGIFDLPNLQLLELRQTNFRSIPDEIQQLQNLRYLKYQGNRNGRQILEITEQIGSLNSLQMLEISDVLLLEIPETIGNLERLEKLGIYNTERLLSIPDSICDLPKLKVLEVVNNSINKLPDRLGSLPLQALDLSNNPLTRLPDSFPELVHLEKLSLEGCRNLEWLPDGFNKLHQLKSLKIKNEQLNYPYLIEQLVQLPNLEVLELLRFKEEPFHLPELFGQLPQLKWLRLKVDQMDTTQTLEVICQISTLQYLDLSPFDLNCLPESLVMLPELQSVRLDIRQLKGKELDLVFEKLSTLPGLIHLDLSRSVDFLPDSIGCLKGLQILDLSFSDITNLPGALSGMELTRIDLRGCSIDKDDLKQIKAGHPTIQIIS